MLIDDMTPVAMAAISEIHRKSGFDYKFPEGLLSTPLFPVRRAGFDKKGRVFIACALKVEAEAYLWLDSEYGTPEERWKAVEEINADISSRARIIGFDQLYCVLPPEIAKSFGPRLKDLGWVEARPWPKYTIELR